MGRRHRAGSADALSCTASKKLTGRMTSLVLQLLADAFDQSVRFSSILRKALMVARKLAVGEIEGWLKQELGDGSGSCSIFSQAAFRLSGCSSSSTSSVKSRII